MAMMIGAITLLVGLIAVVVACCVFLAARCWIVIGGLGCVTFHTGLAALSEATLEEQRAQSARNSSDTLLINHFLRDSVWGST
jgi:hypothetical protein